MTKLKLGVYAIIVVGIATVLLIQHQAQTQLRDENQSLRQQMDQLQVENQRLSNSVAQVNIPSSRPDDQLLELLRLRNDVRMLRQQTNELGKVQAAQANRTKTPQPSADSAAEQQRAFAIMKMNNSKQFALSMIMYSEDNNHQFPTNLNQTVPYLGGNSNPAISNNFAQIEIVYQGTWNSITNPASTIITRDNQAWMYNGKWAKAYAFGDGHVEIHSEPDGNFDAWEREHMVSPPPTQ